MRQGKHFVDFVGFWRAREDRILSSAPSIGLIFGSAVISPSSRTEGRKQKVEGKMQKPGNRFPIT